MGRGEVVLRQWKMLKMLQTRGEGAALRELSAQFDVSERTIQRDFETLSELGFPIHFEADEFGKRFWRMPHDFFRSGALVLGLTEAVALHLARRLLTPLEGTPLGDGFRSVLDMIHALIPQQALDYFSTLDQTILVRRIGQTDYSGHAEAIRLLTQAALEEYCVDLDYRSLWGGNSYPTRVDPYGLVLFDGDLFLVARSHRAGENRIFKVSRIERAAPTTQRFQRPEDFELESHFRMSFGIVQVGAEPIEVAVRFTGAAAGLVGERVWHESQTLVWSDPESTLFEEDPDESTSVIATFQLASLVEFKRWVLGFGAAAEVLRPESLRAEIAAELDTAHRHYAP